MDGWLRAFAYRIELGPGLFLFGTVGTLVVVLLAVGVQTLRAALSNPVDAIRYE